jgi:RNA polymerase sigma-70 factor (ECF subfamily)
VKQFDSETAFWSWLTVLARSSAADEGRRSRRYLGVLARLFEYKQIENEKAADADTRLKELLEINLAALHAEERELVERKYFERESVREIAERMQLSEKAVESRLVRVRRRLKDEIVEQLKHEG